MIIVGLGNPGKQYANTVHNMGFRVIDIVADKLGTSCKQKGYDALYAAIYVRGEKHVIAKPQTYMNLSGQSVKQLLGGMHTTAKGLVVVYDDIDLPIGTLRIRMQGSAGTHNGMRNIVQEIGTTEFMRIRVGVGSARGERELRDYVLSEIRGEQKEILDRALDKAADCVLDCLNGTDTDAIMRKYNGAV